MIELYHNDMSVCAAKVRSVLAEKRLEWKGIHMDLRAGDTQKAEYLKLNPNAGVPTLVHDGRVIIESTVSALVGVRGRWRHLTRTGEVEVATASGEPRRV